MQNECYCDINDTSCIDIIILNSDNFIYYGLEMTHNNLEGLRVNINKMISNDFECYICYDTKLAVHSCFKCGCKTCTKCFKCIDKCPICSHKLE